MTKILDIKQIIHIVSEIVVLIGMAFWFSQSNKKLKSHIDNLERRLDAQEETIKRHEHHLSKIIEAMQNGQPSQDQLRAQIEAQMKAQMQTQMQAQVQAQMQSQHTKSQHTKSQHNKSQHNKSRPLKVEFEDIPRSQIEIHEEDEEEDEEENDTLLNEEEGDAELDEEILAELTELESSDTDNDVHLKKR